MPPAPTQSARPASRPVYLVPFGLLAGLALGVLFGWWNGQVTWVQPRSYDAPLSANAAAGLCLIGLAECLIGLRWRRTGLAVCLVATFVGLATLLQFLLRVDLGIDDLLVNHRDLVAGPGVARMPPALAVVITLTGLLVASLAVSKRGNRLTMLTGLLGSLVLGYAITGLLAYRNGLNFLPAWQAYARLGPHSAILLVLLGSGLIWLAARQQSDNTGMGPRWLWLPVTICGITVTLSFWVSLRERESAYLKSTTQLSMDSVAALFSGEVESRIDSVRRLAGRTDAAGSALNQAAWARDAGALVRDFSGYRSVQLMNTLLHTRWYCPHEGNEEAADYDHGSHPVRRSAILTAHRKGTFGLAAPIENGGAPPSFALYFGLGTRADPTGFIAAEFYYERFFEAIDRRLDLRNRFQMRVEVERSANPPSPSSVLKVFQTSAGNDLLDASLQQSARYRILDQSFIITLTPRPGLVAATRRFLPELTLLSGLGVSLLLGLVTNLAQTAVRRQRLAEESSRLLQRENEERRRIEARLKSADERLNLALESTQAGVFEWDVETDQVFCTPSIWKLIGASADVMPATGTDWLNLLHPDDRPSVRAVIDAHFRGESPLIEIEHCVHLANGEWLWLAFRAKCTSFSATRLPRRVLGTVQNINARKRADEALRTSQAETRKLSLVASKTDNIVVIANAEGLIEWANDSFTRLTGRPLQEVYLQPMLEQLANGKDDPFLTARLRAAMHGGEHLSAEAVQLAADGRRIHISIELQPVLADDGRVENTIAIATDITARIETEQQLRRAKEEADAASRSKTEFLASITHEIRTPMNGVLGMTSLLLETELSPEQRDFVSTIRTSGDSLLAIIDEILDFSQAESGKMALESQTFEVGQLLDEVVDHYTAQAAAKNIELASTIAPEVPACVSADIRRLRQILANLVSNGIKFTARGSLTIEVSAGPTDPEAASDGQIRLDFLVTDTGIGIPADRLGKLFQPFSQVDSSSTRKYGGTGLGLAICQRLSRLMGGDIDVRSVLGEGSCFHFSVMATAVPLTDMVTPPFATAMPAQGPVLVVDDLAVNRTMLERSLRSWSLEPTLASSSAEALVQVATDIPFIAALIDHDLAGESGLELISLIREKRPGLPVILLSPPAVGMKRVDADSDDLVRVAKPLKAHLLQAALKRALVGNTRPEKTTPAAAPVRLAETIPLDILLVEDNPVNRKVAQGYLERLGYKAATATNGREAVIAIKERRFNLVFMDLQMPELDGIGATREVRSQCAADNQPVIVALTANAMQSDRASCLAAGMNDYMTKPLRIENLQSAIQRHFGTKLA